ncbi:MAG: putative metal-binding motif-containing protein [Myxococcota bacterium]
MFRSLCLTALLSTPAAAFGQADTVLWYHGNGGTTTDSTDFSTHVQTQLNGSVDFRNDWANLDLSGYRYVILARPTLAFDAGQIADVEAYLDGGGYLVVAGDSAAAGELQITTINGLLTGIGRSMQLVSGYQFINQVDVGTGQPACTPGSVVNTGGVLSSSNPLSVQSCGDIDPGVGSILENYSVTIDTTTFSSDLLVLEERVLLTSDYDFFTGNACGIIAKRSFWNSLWAVVCDVDDDNAQSVVCGGFDCDDTDPLVGNDFAYYDLDGDGYGDSGNPAPCVVDAVEVGGDCDDDDPDVNPGASEVCDGIDNDCLGGVDNDITEGPEWYADFDGDGFGRDDTEPVIACDAPPNHVDVQGDCDDTNAGVHEGATEVCNNSVDENCNGTADEGCSTVIIPPPDTGGNGGTCNCSSASPGSFLGALVLGALGLAVRRR